MDRTLIVARLPEDRTETVADIFRRSDATDLPYEIGVTRRSLFHFHGLYFHLIESEGDIRPPLARNRRNPLFVDVNEQLADLVSPYDPHTWRGPQDAMARPFYSWHAGQEIR